MYKNGNYESRECQPKILGLFGAFSGGFREAVGIGVERGRFPTICRGLGMLCRFTGMHAGAPARLPATNPEKPSYY